MKGLLIKDLLNLRKQSIIILALFVFYMIMAMGSGNVMMFGFVVTLMTVMLTITSMAFDERSNWDKYALTMPISRKDIVLSKYLLGGILAGLAFVINIIFMTVARSGMGAETALTALGMMGISIFFLSVMMPLFYKFGVERGRLIMMATFSLPTSAVVIAVKVGLKPPDPQVLELLPYIAAGIALLVAGISILISLRIISKKEL